MATQPDLVLYGRDGRLAVIVDIRNKRGTSAEWAARLRENLVAYDAVPAADFFLVATPDRMYLWKGGRNPLEPAFLPPAYVVDARKTLAPYFERAELDPEKISGPAFEMLVVSWLGDLIRSRDLPGDSAREQGWLKDSSFLDVIRNGRIDFPAAA